MGIIEDARNKLKKRKEREERLALEESARLATAKDNLVRAAQEFYDSLGLPQDFFLANLVLSTDNVCTIQIAQCSYPDYALALLHFTYMEIPSMPVRTQINYPRYWESKVNDGCVLQGNVNYEIVANNIHEHRLMLGEYLMGYLDKETAGTTDE